MNKKAIKILIVSVIIAVIVGGTIAGIVVVNLDRKKEKLVVYNWADYIDPANITLFEEYYKQKTGNGRDAVDKQRLLHAREFTLCISQTRFIGDANQRPGGVKQVDQHKREDHAGQAQVQGASQIDMTNHRRHARRRGDDAGVVHIAQHPAQ